MLTYNIRWLFPFHLIWNKRGRCWTKFGFDLASIWLIFGSFPKFFRNFLIRGRVRLYFARRFYFLCHFVPLRSILCWNCSIRLPLRLLWGSFGIVFLGTCILNWIWRCRGISHRIVKGWFCLNLFWGCGGCRGRDLGSIFLRFLII